MRRVQLLVLLLSLPCGLLGLLATSAFLVNPWNPMQLAFLTEFRVRNQLKEPVWITPIGSFTSGGKGVLPQFSAKEPPAIPAWQSTVLRVDPGTVRVVYYDWDDINFTELLVEFADGSQRLLLVDPNPPTDGYSPNKQKEYFISDRAKLHTVSKESVKAAHSRRPVWLFRFLVVCASTLPYWSFRWWRAGRNGTIRSTEHA